MILRTKIADLFLAVPAELFFAAEVAAALSLTLVTSGGDRFLDFAGDVLPFFGGGTVCLQNLLGGFFILFFLFILFSVELLRLLCRFFSLFGKLFFVLGIQQLSS